MDKNKVYRYGKITMWTGYEYFAIVGKIWLGREKEYFTFKTREKLNETVDELRKSGYTLISY